jgi:hypothetical protein
MSAALAILGLGALILGVDVLWVVLAGGIVLALLL